MHGRGAEPVAKDFFGDTAARVPLEHVEHACVGYAVRRACKNFNMI